MPASIVASPHKAILMAAGFGTAIVLAALAMALPVRAETPAPQMSSSLPNAASIATQRSIGKNLDLAVRRPAYRPAVEYPATTSEPHVNLWTSPDHGRGHEAASQ